MSRRSVKALKIDEAEDLLKKGELTPSEIKLYRDLYKYATLRLNQKMSATSAYRKVYPESSSKSAAVNSSNIDKCNFVRTAMAKSAAYSCRAAQINADFLVAQAMDLVSFNPKDLSKNGSFIQFDKLTDAQAAAITKVEYLINRDGDQICKLGWVSKDKALAALKDMYVLYLKEKQMEMDREAIEGEQIPEEYKDKASFIVGKYMAGSISEAAAKEALSIMHSGVSVANADLMDIIADLQDRVKELS